MTSADGKNTIFYGLYGENGLGEPKAIKVGDTWYKPNGTGTDMLVWTGTIWKVLLDAETFNEAMHHQREGHGLTRCLLGQAESITG